MSNQEQNLDACDCCEGLKKLTPMSVENLPGLSALAYRVGTHGSFKATMLTAIAEQPRLRELTTRDDDDPAIALLDGWATVLDVLSFYQERIANEGFLRTATERLSILELARSIGYELRGGVAASTYLAFTVEAPRPTSPETELALRAQIPDPVMIDSGTKAQSVPGPGELPQTFETVEKIEARAAWQGLRVKATATALPKFGDANIYLQGNATNLKPGDAVLILGKERRSNPGNEDWDFRRVTRTETVAASDPTEPQTAYTIVSLDRPLGSTSPPNEPTKLDPKVYALRRRAALFGYNAPDWRAMPATIKEAYPADDEGGPNQWPGFTIRGVNQQALRDRSDTQTIHLDAPYAEIVPGSWIVMTVLADKKNEVEVYKVITSNEDARANFAMSSKTTRLTVRGERLAEIFNKKLRETMVFAHSEELQWAELPIAVHVGQPAQNSEDFTNEVVLHSPVTGLKAGQLVSITGLETHTGQPSGEVRVLSGVGAYGKKLSFTEKLTNHYLRSSVLLNANVARATHGERKTEVLGSGDGSRPFQKFALKQKPLTFVPAPTSTGTTTTLEVRVNDVLWEGVESFYRQPTDRRCYVTRLADDGQVTVQFGNGINGARLPTGPENVKASYRVGVGLPGLVKAGQISLLMSRPLGLKEVLNPQAPAGAEDPEKLEQARANAPLTVLTLERIVSLRDYEDFARAFAGIGKAQATMLTNGELRLVHLTVAGVNGAELEPDSAAGTNLRSAIDAARHAQHQVRIDSIDAESRKLFAFSARLLIDPTYIAEQVEAEARAALLAAFSFELREFGQAVTESEIVAVAQKVKGVVAVLAFELPGADAQGRLLAQRGRFDETQTEPLGTRTKPAELLLIDPDRITLHVEIA